MYASVPCGAKRQSQQLFLDFICENSPPQVVNILTNNGNLNS